MRAAVHPLGLIDEHQTRTLDFGVGYVLESVARSEEQLVAQGPYIEVAAYPLQHRIGEWTTRGGLRTSADVLMGDDGSHRTGYGAGVALAVEIATFAHGGFTAGGGGGGIAGFSHGEAGVGGFLGVSQRRFGDDAYWLASAGVSLRLPATAGLVCCLQPK